jgi:hypothetical protein
LSQRFRFPKPREARPGRFINVPSPNREYPLINR